MTDNLSVAIERLRTSTQKLNSVCDAAGQTIRDVEAFLEESHVGISAGVVFERVPEDDEGQYYTDISLNYGRHAATGKFRILVVSCPQWVQSDNDLSIRPWSECSRDEKLASFEKLPALIEELANEVHKRASTAEQTVASVNAILPKKRKGG